MKDELIGKALASEPTTNWELLRHLSDTEIHEAILDDPDMIPTDEDFWQKATIVLPQQKLNSISKPG